MESVRSTLKHALFLCCIIETYWSAHGFNIDVMEVSQMNGDKNSLFGASAAFSPKDSRLFIGAPKDGDMGMMHIYTISPTGGTSEYDSIYYGMGQGSEDGSMGEGFGSSVSVMENNDFIVCSPQWKDTRRIPKEKSTFMPGRCTLVKPSGDSETLRPYFKRGGSYFLRTRAGGEYDYGLAAYGFSSHSVKDVFVVSAPGVLTFEGSLQIRDGSNITRWRSDIKNQSHVYGYMGYSVRIGSFCAGNEICFAAGAPNLKHTGRVFMFRWKSRETLEVFDLLEGDQEWSRFGSVLDSIDVDNDTFDELFVGAPFYSDLQDKQSGPDQGRVHIYSIHAQSGTFQHKLYLDGEKTAYARFGSAIASVGDINLDKYLDVAVGAPGEDDGAGAVYIYLGGMAGLNNKASQRIAAKKVTVAPSATLSGLGSTLTGFLMYPSNKYPMFAASAVQSDSVLLFKCRPVLKFEANLTAEPNPINTEQEDLKIKVTFCLQHVIQGVGRKRLHFKVDLDIDTKKKSDGSKRAMFEQRDGSLTGSLSMTNQPILGRGTCMDYTAVLKEKQVNKDRFTPMDIAARFELDENHQSPQRPVMDYLVPHNVTHTVTFDNECGPDRKCDVDLQLTGSLIYDHKGDYNVLVVNHTSEFHVDMRVANSGEPSYWTVVKVRINWPFIFSRFTSSTAFTCKGASDQQETIVICNCYKRLTTDQQVSLRVSFDTEYIPLSQSDIKVTAETESEGEINNPEENLADNKIEKLSNIFIISEVDVQGKSSPTEVTIYEAKEISASDRKEVEKTSPDEVLENVREVNLTHLVQVKNLGPSFLPRTSINVSVPGYLTDGSVLCVRLSVKLTTDMGQEIPCEEIANFDRVVVDTTTSSSTSVDGSTSNQSTTSSRTTSTVSTTTEEDYGPVNRRKRSAGDEGGVQLEDDVQMDVEKENSGNVYTLSCDKDPKYCRVFSCPLDVNLKPKGHAEITIDFSVDRDNIPMPEGVTTFHLKTTTAVTEPLHPLFKKWDHPVTEMTTTVFHLVESGGEISIWIIVGSVIAGLFLIFIIVLILWKVGFFKRDKHYQVERWRRESQRRPARGKPETSPDQN